MVWFNHRCRYFVISFPFTVACVPVIYTAVYVVGCFMDDFVSLSVRELSSFHLFVFRGMMEYLSVWLTVSMLVVSCLFVCVCVCVCVCCVCCVLDVDVCACLGTMCVCVCMCVYCVLDVDVCRCLHICRPLCVCVCGGGVGMFVGVCVDDCL